MWSGLVSHSPLTIRSGPGTRGGACRVTMAIAARPAPILPPLGPTQPPRRENNLGAAGFACLRAYGKKYILAATERDRHADTRSAGQVLPMEML